MKALATIFRAIRVRWALWILMTVGFVVAYYAMQLVILYVRLGHWPNYVTAYDYPANVAQIIRSTPAVSDMIPIILNEWLFEIAYINYDYGHGIAEWTLAVLPAKLLVIALTSAVISADILVWRRTRASCPLVKRQIVTGATGIGALLVGLANISLSWVVCCAAPNWVVGLTLLGLESQTSFWLEPYGLWLALVGVALLAGSMLWLAGRGRGSPHPTPPQGAMIPDAA